MSKALWQEVIGEAMDEAGIVATPQQIAAIASAAESMHENYGQAVHVPDHPLIRENKELKDIIRKEQSKRHCRECDGRGSIVSRGPYHSSVSQCWKCGGEGKVAP